MCVPRVSTMFPVPLERRECTSKGWDFSKKNISYANFCQAKCRLSANKKQKEKIWWKKVQEHHAKYYELVHLGGSEERKEMERLIGGHLGIAAAKGTAVETFLNYRLFCFPYARKRNILLSNILFWFCLQRSEEVTNVAPYSQAEWNCLDTSRLLVTNNISSNFILKH